MKTLPLVLALLTGFALSPSAQAEDPTRVDLRILAINDFHGNLKPPAGGIRIRDPKDPAKTVTVAAGGAEAMATLIKERRAQAAHSIFVSAGDLVGASPLLSALFSDEPTIESMGLMGLEASAVGNHEFDKGSVELLRKQNGGCGGDNVCRGPHPFAGAKFQYLAASTIDRATGRTLLPPYVIKTWEGLSVAFVGLTLKGTPDIVSPSGVAGLEFRDEAETINALVPELKAKGIEAIVALIHEGGYPTGDYDECPGISGPIVDITKRLDKAVGIVISGHTHKAYDCVIDGRLVTSADKFGTVVTEIDVSLDRRTRGIATAKARNLIVRTDALAKDPEQTALIAGYEAVAGPLIARPVGRISAAILRRDPGSGEWPLGDLIADAQLAATRAPDKGAAVAAVTNPGGIRTDLPMTADGTVTYGEIFAAQPFGNNLVTLTLTGAELKTMLEQQWSDPAKPRILQVSEGFHYTWDAAKPAGEKIDAASIEIGGEKVVADRGYRITVNDFLADGGDGFKVLKNGRDRLAGGSDVDALEAHLKTAGTIDPPQPTRIRRVN
jgi:5'-nucleotidase